MFKIPVLLFLFCLAASLKVNAQSSALTATQQNEDFEIFTGGLQEGHSGLYYYIDKPAFEKLCDSIKKTFQEGATIEDYYLKLRFIITSLHHGHTRISLPTHGNVNYKMAVLDSTKLYLPYEFLIVNKQLLIKKDCSKEQLIPEFSVVKSINNVTSKVLVQKMLSYMPADGINQTFKYYSLCNYFYFHFLFNLFYPGKKGIKLELENNKTHFYTELLKPRVIDSIYFARNKKSISGYDKQLDYKSNLPNRSAYLKIASFYKGLIENFGQKYEPFIDSAFSSIRSENIRNLILDLRNNEGGGDGYDNMLLSYLMDTLITGKGVIKVPGREFRYNKYAVNLTDDIKGFIENPSEFLRDDSTLYIKDSYVEMMTEGNINPPGNKFKGRIIVLINGGSFSAANAVIGHLYKYRKNLKRQILFVGEENGGDIYSSSGCAGQGYIIKLPNSSIQVDMPFLCFGEFKKEYPKKRLPDYQIFDKITDLKAGRDHVLDFAIKICQEK
jgi:Peptidase family S41